MKVVLGILIGTLGLAQTPLSVEAKHDHWRRWCVGQLTVDDKGIAFESASKKGHRWRWGYLDLQQVKVLDDGEVSVLTYADNKWRLGADREFHFLVADKQFAAQVSPLLESRLERRFVSGLAARPGKALWELPAKHLLRFSGSEGTLAAAEDRIVYRTDRPGESRTWLFSDIDHISKTSPDQLTITTHERARSHYGSLKEFNFQLKQPLAEDRYDELWKRLEKSKGLQILTTAREDRHAP